MTNFETLRSTFLPSDTLNGSKIFLSFSPQNNLYYIHTRFQWLKKSKSLQKITHLWESYSVGSFK